jgi:hypothetical protein
MNRRAELEVWRMERDLMNRDLDKRSQSSCGVPDSCAKKQTSAVGWRESPHFYAIPWLLRRLVMSHKHKMSLPGFDHV